MSMREMQTKTEVVIRTSESVFHRIEDTHARRLAFILIFTLQILTLNPFVIMYVKIISLLKPS